MAKKRKRGHRTGSVITTRRLNGLGNIKQPASFTGAVVPPLAGGLMTGAAMFAAERLTTPDGSGGAQDMINQYSPVVGMLAGGLTALALKYMAGPAQALSAVVATIVVGGTVMVKKYVDSSGSTTSGLGYYGGRPQFGAVVAERMNPRVGTGAIVMEPYGQQGYGNPGGGERVSLGAINPTAFGTPGFDM